MQALYFDLILRSACLMLLVLIVINLVRHASKNKQHQLLLMACLSTSALLIGLTPDAFTLPLPVYYTVRLLDVPHLVFIWLFGLSLFRHDFTVNKWHLLCGLVYCLPIIWVRFVQFGLLDELIKEVVIVSNIFTVLLVSHLLYAVIGGHGDDLSVERRKVRRHFIILVGVIAVLISLSEIFVVSSEENLSAMATVKVVAIFPAVLWACLWLLQLKGNAFDFNVKITKQDDWSKSEKTLYEQIQQELVHQRAYLEHGLTIAKLATRLATTQTKLRSLINTRLGYENFSAFINSYRIDAVKKVFENPDNNEKSILSIALDNGFASLSPFNRAFVKFVGVTPTEYRNSLLNKDS